MIRFSMKNIHFFNRFFHTCYYPTDIWFNSLTAVMMPKKVRFFTHCNSSMVYVMCDAQKSRFPYGLLFMLTV